MPANVEQEFQKGFLLDEERLRKLHSLIRDRLTGSAAEGHLHFKVYRGDAFSYNTDDLDSVLAEDNSDWRRVTRLDLLVKTETLELRLTFSTRRGTDLNIEGSDRDQVFLLFSDIREYLQEEVNLARINAHTLSQTFPILLLLVMMVTLVAITVNKKPSASELEAALGSADPIAKLDFLVGRYKHLGFSGQLGWKWLAVMTTIFVITIISLTELPARGIAAIFPYNVFMFGSQKVRFEKRRRLVGNVLWVVVIGFIVSLAASLVVWLLTSRQP